MRNLLKWFATNHVAANLLMLMIIAFGISSAISIKQEVFPEVALDTITIQVPYLGATPAEVEDAVCVVVEEAIQGIEGIKKLTSSATEGVGTVTAEIETGEDVMELLDKIKAAVDRIVTFPAETEKPIVSRVEPKSQVLNIVIYGDVGERVLKQMANTVRDDVAGLDEVTYATVIGTRAYEISIEVSEAALRRYGLTLDAVTQIVRASSLDLPGGSVKTDGGEILIRTKGQRYTGPEYADIVVVTRPDGTNVTLADIGTVIDGFADIDVASRFDGKPAVQVGIYRVGEEGVLDVADAAKQYVADSVDSLPEGVSMATWYDSSNIYRSRMMLLLKNGAVGLILVFICLTLFLQMRLAFWVSLGIGISFMGAFWLLPLFDTSLNMISLFAFIVSLGLVVDDAIVVGENIYAKREKGLSAGRAALHGVREVANPVIFAVLTTVVAFLPLAHVEGTMGTFMKNIPIVVIAVLVFSLVESLFILPAHLSTIKTISTEPKSGGLADRLGKSWFQKKLAWFIAGPYSKSLDFALRRRPLTLAIAIAALLITVGIVKGGHIRFTFMPRVDADQMTATLTMPQGTTAAVTEAALTRIETALGQLREEMEDDRDDGEESIFKHVSTSIGSQPSTAGRGPMSGGGIVSASHIGEVNCELLAGEKRDMPSSQLARRWRELTGPIPGATSLVFAADLFHGGKAIQIDLASPQPESLVAAADDLKLMLADYPGVTDISDSFDEGKFEMKLSLKPEARTLGLTLSDLARQVRQGFYGDEVKRIQRGRDEVKVMVRYPESERRSLGNIESMRIRTPAGGEVPFSLVAEVEIGRGYATISRAERSRIVTVYGDIDQSVTNANEVLADLQATGLLELRSRYPGLRYDFEGQERDRMESMGSLRGGFIMALLMIFGLLAMLFRSYLQPLAVMFAIPFGLMGAVWGHLLTGWDLTLLSMFGVVALTGVVVNDSLIMIDFINRARQEGCGVGEAVRLAGVQRFRPIILTSMTTFAGLTPLLLEQSLQARFLIPMAISLGFGVVFATAITLLLVPVAYTLISDAKLRLGFSDDMTVEDLD